MGNIPMNKKTKINNKIRMMEIELALEDKHSWLFILLLH